MLSFEDDDEFGDMPELPPSVSLETYKPKTPPRPVLPATTSSFPSSPLHQPQQQPQQQHQPAPQLDDDLDTPSLSQIQQSPEQEKPKTKRLARDVAKLDANRLLAPEGLPRLHQITKQLSLKGKKHEFDDLAHMMLTYQKWGHSVFNKLVFTSFIEGAEKVCREKRVKGWRDALVSEERRRKNGFYDDEDVVVVGGGGAGMGEKEQLDVTMADAEAIKNQVPINKALAEIDDLNREEEEEFERLVREAEAQHAANQSQPPKSTTRSMTFEDDDDDFDFDSQMREQLGVSTTTVSNSNTKNAAPTFAEEDDYEHEFNQAISSNMMEEDDFNFDMPVDPIASVPPLINGTEDQIDSEAANPLVSSTIAPPVDTNLPSQVELDALVNDFDWDGE
ncbi:Swi3-domain-containing protein [Rhizoclosmatium globosum]|uniref:Chromosome segregation in meiosis protein n=1 Tax=Rhizoclosmatium globosum TaxID=329046 RepID=A0A1Y2BTE0_9FUNG|nr:Swi3-domain-containing protein [Rhizoclosmatium globosum]|eukprot:ORY37964.1 Swi3-domain-containing protein [Rhizoclosmatium globosum]